MYVRTYVRTYVCMYVWMDGWMYGCMDVWMYGCMYVCMYVCMYRLVDSLLLLLFHTADRWLSVALVRGTLNRRCSAPPSPPALFPPAPCPLPRQVLSLTWAAPAVVLGCSAGMTSWLSWEPRRGNKVQPWCELHRPVDHAETHPDPPSFRVSDVVPDQAEPVHPEPGEAARASGSSGDSESERATEGDAVAA